MKIVLEWGILAAWPLPPSVSPRIIPPTAADCFTWLMRGDVDVVTLDKLIALAEMSKLGLDGRVAEIAALRSSQTLHVVAPKDDPEARRRERDEAMGLIEADEGATDGCVINRGALAGKIRQELQRRRAFRIGPERFDQVAG